MEILIGSRDSIWINTEAGGEITQVFSLCRKLKQKYPGYNLLVSTHKYDAYLLAHKIAGIDYVFFSPWDITWVVRKVLKRIDPVLLIASEIVTAPVLFREASRLGIKTFLCSGFMSKNLDDNQILKRAMALQFYKWLDFVGVKQKIDKEGFEKLGCPAESVKLLGDLKYDVTKIRVLGKSRQEWLEEFGLDVRCKVLLGASIHPGEDRFLIDAFALLRQQDPEFRLIIAPRFNHFINKIESYLRKQGYSYVKRTELTRKGDCQETVIIIDTFGELAYLYAAASYAVIGSSIYPADPLGGHNVIEPMVNGVPFFFGSHMLKASEVVNELKKCWRGLEIYSQRDLARNILELDNNEVLKEKIKTKLNDIVGRHKNSAENHVKFIEHLLSGADV